jgi:hypothetical protein
VGFDGKVTTLSKSQVSSLSVQAMKASVKTAIVHVYRGTNETMATMRARLVSIKVAITKANPGLTVTGKYYSASRPSACASRSNRCAVVLFNS